MESDLESPQPLSWVGLVSYIWQALAVLVSTLAVAGWFPGFSTAYGSILLTAGTGLAWALSLGRSRLRFTEIIGTTLFVWLTAIHALSFREFASARAEDVFLRNAAQSLLLPALYWLTGLSLARPLRAGSWGIKVTLWAAWTVASVAVVVGTLRGQQAYGEYQIYFRDYATDLLLNYLAVADSVAMSGFLLIGLLRRNRIAVVLIFLVTAVILVFAYSRTTLYLWIAVAGAPAFLFFWRGKKLVPILVAPLLALGLYALLAFVLPQSGTTVDRALSLLNAPMEDESVLARQEAISYSWEFLAENWHTGAYLIEWWSSGEEGTYVHNWMSFLIAFGAGPAVLFTLLAVRAWRNGVESLQNPGMHGAFLLLVFSILAIVVARSFMWPIVWMPLALLARSTPMTPVHGGSTS